MCWGEGGVIAIAPIATPLGVLAVPRGLHRDAETQACEYICHMYLVATNPSTRPVLTHHSFDRRFIVGLLYGKRSVLI